MPGSSLWLVPPKSHPLHDILTTLITKSLPSLIPSSESELPPPPFLPHLTLTSNIPPEVYSPGHATDPQSWFDSLPFPAASDVHVRFESPVRSEDVFFRRCYIKAAFAGIRDLAAVSRARGVNNEEVEAGSEKFESGWKVRVGERTTAWLEEWRSAFGPHVSLM